MSEHEGHQEGCFEEQAQPWSQLLPCKDWVCMQQGRCMIFWPSRVGDPKLAAWARKQVHHTWVGACQREHHGYEELAKSTIFETFVLIQQSEPHTTLIQRQTRLMTNEEESHQRGLHRWDSCSEQVDQDECQGPWSQQTHLSWWKNDTVAVSGSWGVSEVFHAF